MLTRKILFGFVIALLSTTSLVAQDDDTKAKKALDRVKKKLTANVMKSFAKTELTDDQKAQATAVVENHIVSYAAAKKAQESVLTEDHIASRKVVLENAKADGVKRKAACAAATEAMGLTEEEKASYVEATQAVSL